MGEQKDTADTVETFMRKTNEKTGVYVKICQVDSDPGN